jgi:hypothetical protein
MNLFKSIPKVKLQKIVFVVIVTLIALGAMANFWIGHQWSIWSSSRDEIAKLGGEIDELQAVAQEEASNTELRDRIEAFITAQRQRMISGDPFSWVVREVSLLAEKHPVRVTGMRPGGGAPNLQRSKYEIFIAILEVSGSYDNLGLFVRDFENKFPTSQIRSLEMTALDPSRSQCRVTLECALPLLPASPTKPAAKPLAEAKS